MQSLWHRYEKKFNAMSPLTPKWRECRSGHIGISDVNPCPCWFVHSFVYSHICGPVLMDHPQIIAYGVSNGHVIEVFDGGLAEVYTLLVFCLVIYIKKYTLRTDESTSDQRPHIWENSNGHISP